MNKYITYIEKNDLGLIYLNKTFKEITTIKIGGRISLLFYPNSTFSFIKFYRYFIKYNDYNLIVIGNGSNILANDNDFSGIVVSFKLINEIKVYNQYVTVTSGYQSVKLAKILKYLNLAGGEFLSVIPGTIGGIVTMNASSYNSSISDILYECLCIDEQGAVKWIRKNDMELKYRSSIFKKGKFIILKVCLKLKKGNSEEIQKLVNKYIINKNATQPLDQNSAGSVFKNPHGYKAWKLIKDLNIKSKYPDIEVADKHKNFIINKNNAKASDVYKLVNEIRKKALDEYNINLECEWTFINFNDNKN